MKKIVVTKIINKYEVLLNIGTDDGISKDSEFDVLGKLEEVFDPITNEPLGELPYTKVRLKVKTLFPKMCICEDNQNCVQTAYSRMLETSFFKTEAVKNELNFDVDDYVEQQIDKTICIGDEVLWTNYPGQEIQDTNNKEQETDN